MSAILFHSILDVVLTAQQGFEDNVIDSGPEQVHIDTDLLKMAAKSTEGPFVAIIVLLAVLVFNKLFILLVNRVVSQVHVLVSFIDFRGISLRSESSKTLLENINSHWLIRSNKYINSQIELMTINKQRVGHIPRNN